LELKSQSFRNKFGKAHPLRTKFGMDMSRDDNVQGILVAIGPFWAKWGWAQWDESKFSPMENGYTHT